MSQTPKERMIEAKELLDMGLLTQEEYNKVKEKCLEEMVGETVPGEGIGGDDDLIEESEHQSLRREKEDLDLQSKKRKHLIVGVCVVGVLGWLGWQYSLHQQASELKSRGKDVGRHLSIGFPYDAGELSRYEEEVLRAEKLNSKGLEIVARATEIGWELDIVGYSYDAEELNRIEEDVSISEQLHPQVLNIEKEWTDKGLSPLWSFPYSENQISYWGDFEVLIPAGSFDMGCTKGDSKCYSHESPVHEVCQFKPQ